MQCQSDAIGVVLAHWMSAHKDWNGFYDLCSMVLLALHSIATVCFDLYGDFNTISDSMTLLEPWTGATANCLTNSIEFMFAIILWYLATPSTPPSVTWDGRPRMFFKGAQSISCQIRSATSLLGATLSLSLSRAQCSRFQLLCFKMR